MKPWLQAVTPALEGALTAAARWSVAPCHVTFRADGKKQITSGSLAMGWQTGSGASAEQIRTAFANGANAYLIACGPSGLVVADLDVKAGVDGPAAWRGRIPGGLVVRTQSGGLHHYYRNDAQIGCPAGGMPGVDIKGIGGGVFGPGSLNGTYQVLASGELPPWSVLGLQISRSTTSSAPARQGFWAASISAESADRSIAAELAKVTEHARAGAANPAAWSGFRNTLELHAAYVIGGYLGSGYLDHGAAVTMLQQAILTGCGQLWPDSEASIERGLADGAARPLEVRPPLGSESAAALTTDAARPTNLPGGFWDARELLWTVRNAAHSRGRCPDAVLGVRLAKLASLIPGGVRADSGMATPTPLNFFTLLHGSPNTGKSSSAEIGESEGFLGDGGTDRYPLGSGQGIAAAYGEVVDGVFTQTRHNALFYRDEAAALFDAKRNDVVLATLRDAWSGRPFGQKNANDERNRYVRNYSIGLWAGLQPVHVTKLLCADNIGDGTLARFVFFSAADPSIPRSRPGRQAGMPMVNRVFLQELVVLGLSVPEWLKDELWERDWQRVTGTTTVDAGDEHWDLRRLRVALLLAVEEQRRAPDATDWQLAGAVMETHSAILSCARRDTAALAEQAQHSRIKRDITARHAALDADEVREERKVESMVLKVVVKVTEKPGRPRAELIEAFRDRATAKLAIELAIERGLVKVKPAVTRGETIWPGELS